MTLFKSETSASLQVCSFVSITSRCYKYLALKVAYKEALRIFLISKFLFKKSFFHPYARILYASTIEHMGDTSQKRKKKEKKKTDDECIEINSGKANFSFFLKKETAL